MYTLDQETIAHLLTIIIVGEKITLETFRAHQVHNLLVVNRYSISLK